MKPICVPCQRFFRPKKNGFHFIEGMPKANETKPGTAEPENWAPYKMWVGDLWECPACGSQIVSGCPTFPMAEHYEAGFRNLVALHKADQFQVNDC